MKPLISAIQFLTILPIGKKGTFVPDRMLPFFPIVGLLIGLLLCMFDLFAKQFWPLPAVAVLDTVFLIIITGALHLDGICDTADGLYGGAGDPNRSLHIMKDSSAGAIGVVAVICVFAVKSAGIFSMDDHRMLLLLIVPAYARGATLFGFAWLPYGRPEGGTGHDFFHKKITVSTFGGLLIPFFLSFFLGWGWLVFNICFLAGVAAILFFYQKRLGCITGDMLGAMTEAIEAFLFLIGAIHL
ncbi:MAG: adenosylcobinamide-GDP ribazoletransferase [Desulfobacteraceae bacterium]|nr:MAG: adenosylcobinamide-GDP ribazoletransferase [Desulfobacteraceae bacterium]